MVRCSKLIDDLKDFELDHAVARALGLVGTVDYDKQQCVIHMRDCSTVKFAPTKSWAQGGPIVQSEVIDIRFVGFPHGVSTFCASKFEKESLCFYASTPLQAAMKCFVAHKSGSIAIVYTQEVLS